MKKHVVYVDEYENKIDLSTIDGISTIFNDLFANASDKYACQALMGNIKVCVENCYENRILEMKGD